MCVRRQAENSEHGMHGISERNPGIGFGWTTEEL